MGELRPPWVMEVGVLIFLLAFTQVLGAPPEIFDEYFQQGVKAVHLSQREVIKACLPEQSWRNLLNKFKDANAACKVANDQERFDWATLAKLNKGGDGDGNGVQYNLESAEGCLYRELGWTDGEKLKTGRVKKDFEDLPSDVLSLFEAEMKTCNDWNGDFKSRKKREVGVEEVENEENMEVEQVEGAGRLLSWAEDLLPRSLRSVGDDGLPRRKRASKRKGSGKGKGKGKGRGKGKKKGKGKGKKKKTKSKRGKKNKQKKKGKSNSKTSEKSGGSGLDQEVYNQLWCADLVIENALRRCAMAKITG